MKFDRKSLGVRFLVPILALFLITSLGLLALITVITNHIREDYQEFTVQAAASNVTTILEMAAAELTTAKLTGSTVVVEAKKKNVLEAIRISWSRAGQEGLIAAADGTVLISTLDPGPTRSILSHRVNGPFSLDIAGEHYLCISNYLPLWGWDIITVAEHSMSSHADKEVKWLLPAIILALMLLSAGSYMVFRRSISKPIAAMVSNVSKGHDVVATGISEFDEIGRAVNDAFTRERDRTEEVENELGERMRAQGLLYESEERISLLLNSIAEGIYGVDLQGNCTFCNPAALRLLGYQQAEDIIGKQIHEIIHHTWPDGTPYPADDCRIYRCYHTGDGYHADNEVFWRSDGTSFPVEYWAHPIFHEGEPIGAVTAFVDITERKRLDEMLRKTNELFALFMRHSPIYTYIKEVSPTESRVLQASDNFYQMIGVGGRDMIGKTMEELFPAEFAGKITADDWAVVAKGEVLKIDEDLNGRNYTTMKFPIKQGNNALLAGYTIDITEQKRMEEALKRSENLLQTIIDTEPDCVKMIDAQGNLLMMNRAGLDMIEVDSFEQVRGQCVCPMITSDYRQAFMDLTSRVFEGQSGTLIFEMVGLRGRHVWLETRAVPFRNEHNAIIALLGITRDITERRRLEELLRQSQKMESIGTLAGGVAHDFNNILSAISGYGHMTLMKMAPNDPHRPNIQHILEASDRAAHLTKDLLMFSRKQPIDRKPIDLNEGIQKVGKFLTRVIGEDIAFKTILSGGAIPVFADAYQIDQVLMNLATNARDAMPKGGIFTITTEQALLNESFTSSHGLGMPGNYAVISVSDTGEGMNEETRQRIFEPFFTTKEVGKGTGLGLSVVYGIVQQHDGQVTVYSEPGHGTTFRIYLPVNEAIAASENAPIEMEQPVGGAETILLAEDDSTLRELTVMILEDFGYTVITAVDGQDAVNKFTENKDRVQLLLLDLIMPRMSGKDAYDAIRLTRPDIKVIFASGYDPDMVRQKTLIEQNVPVVYKPVPMATLLKKIRVVLDNGEA